MAINKVEINGEVKLDLTQDTVSEDTLLQGTTAHDAAGNPVEGKVVTTPIPVTEDVLKGDGRGGIGTMQTSPVESIDIPVGIFKGTESGNIEAAMPGTDYLAEAPVTSVNGKTGDVQLVKADVGLSQVHNVTQYSVKNPPPYPVRSVNGKTGDVTVSEVPSVTASDNGKIATVINGVWSAKHPTSYGPFSGASASAAGAVGLVPSPKKGQQNRYLKGDGTWADVLPQVAASDNGKFLRVVSGAWAAVSLSDAHGGSF